MKKSIGVALLTGVAACTPMKYAYLTPRTSIADVQAGAKRLDSGGWEICLSLPGTATDWAVSLVEPFEIIRQNERGRSNYSWIIPAERWRNPGAFGARVTASGIDQMVTIHHPTRETVISTGVVTMLDIVFLPSKIPH